MPPVDAARQGLARTANVIMTAIAGANPDPLCAAKTGLSLVACRTCRRRRQTISWPSASLPRYDLCCDAEGAPAQCRWSGHAPEHSRQVRGRITRQTVSSSTDGWCQRKRSRARPEPTAVGYPSVHRSRSAMPGGGGPVFHQRQQMFKPVCLVSGLVRTDPCDARKPHRNTRFMPRRKLRGVKCDFQHQ